MDKSTTLEIPVWSRPIPVTAGWVCILATVSAMLLRVWDGLFIPWWFNTDEVVFYYEVIRQLRLDPSQTFFDIPGTPYMTLTSLCTALWWAFARVCQLTQTSNPSDFAFENVQGVYQLMRMITLGGYAVTVGLSYEIFRRASGVVTGVIAAMLVATLPIHVHYSHFVRTESLGLMLCLGAVLLLQHPRTARRWPTYLAAGIMAGIAMGARFHFALVGLPILLAIYFWHDRPVLRLDDEKLPVRRLLVAGACLGAILAVGGLLAILFKLGVIPVSQLTHTMLLTTPAGPAEYAGAKQAIAKFWMLLGGASLALSGAVWLKLFPRHLPFLVNTFTLCLLTGFAGGFLLSHPTFLWRGEHQLRSIQFYSDWVDPNLQALGPLGSWWNVTKYYFNAALPEKWVQFSFIAGIVAIGWNRRSLPVSFLIGAAVCFVAHPVTMKLWPHHIIPWLPFLCFVAAYPLGQFIQALTGRSRWPAANAVVVLACAGLLTLSLTTRTAKAGDYVNTSRARVEQIAEMNRWLTAHMPADSFLAVSYFSLNGDGFLKWIESAGVSVPQHVKRFRDLQIWWLQRGTLDGKAGYVCVSRADIAFFREDSERRNPSSTYNPFEDRRFEELATFGGGFYELKVFKFDLRQPAAR